MKMEREETETPSSSKGASTTDENVAKGAPTAGEATPGRPATAANAGECRLPSELYWSRIRPFQRPADRAPVSRRCTTRFSAGTRCPIDAAFAERYMMTMPLPAFVRRQDTGLLQFDFKGGADAAKRAGDDAAAAPSPSGDAAAAHMRGVRDAWDADLATLRSPAERLKRCLKLMDGIAEDADTCPLLFCGRGALGDVVKFHAETSPGSLRAKMRASPPGAGLVTQLEHWVNEYLSTMRILHAFDRGESSGPNVLVESIQSQCCFFRDVIDALLEEGADVAPFFDAPADDHFLCQWFAWDDEDDAGASLHRAMTLTAMTLDAREHDTAGLDWLIRRLGLRRARTHDLRFTRGSSVECRLGDGWKRGLVADVYPDRHPYIVKLDDGTSVYAPFDTDEVIRAGEERPLRFREGDAVEILLKEGWQAGVVEGLWEMGHPYWVYIEPHDGEPVFMAVPFDSDDIIRSVSKDGRGAGAKEEGSGSEQDTMAEERQYRNPEMGNE